MNKPESFRFPQHKSRKSSLYESSSYVHTKSDAESAYTLHVEIDGDLYVHFTFYPERPATNSMCSVDEICDDRFGEVFCLICLRLMNTGEMMWMNESQ